MKKIVIMWGDGSLVLRTPAVRLLAGIVLLAAAFPLFADESAREERPFALEIGPFVGFVVPDPDLTATKDPAIQPTLGLHLGRGFHRRLNGFVEAQTARFDSKSLSGDAAMLAARGGVEFLVAPGRRAEPFVSASWGYMRMTFDNATDFVSAFASVGLGQHIQVGARLRARWEVRVDRTLARDGLRGEDLTHATATAGIDWVLGKRVFDSDRDGVAGHRDRCPDTPAGILVDERGCPRDSDRDGVFDQLDACADTPAGWAVDAIGCPADTDRDGVPDPIDACGATPPGATPNARGCPADTDGDGVFDGLDRCPDTLRGIEVDAHGCFLDEDQDGVYDGLGMDRCPGTRKGTKVDAFGCPLIDTGES